MFDRVGIIVAGSTFIFSLILFFLQNGEFLGSLAAAILATGLAWPTYIILLWTYQALRR